ncbi:MAG: sigma-70 family RNA polymerase sigma factor [Gammaproteobacteria bacterium]|nr:sigma-70 family RNA polymerase sigma factor [Gammaproteobacteria bacterium]
MAAAFERSLPTQAEFHEAISNRSRRWFSACLRITRDRALAEDAVQEALLHAWHKRHQFQGDARLDTWIHRIAINTALTLLRRQRPGIHESLEGDIAGSGNTPESDVANHDLGDSLSRALRHLTELEQICFVLKHLEQWRLKEIANELGTSISVVKQALFRGVRKLRVTMADIQSR